MENKIILPAEWYPQSAVQLTWPHEETDWAPILDEVIPCFVSIAKEVIKHEKLLIVCPDEQEVRRQLGDVDDSRIIFREMATNDTWARDHGGITVFDQGEPVVYDFVFNGWGMKFAANLDNLVTRNLSVQGTFADGVQVINMQPFVLEGGSIESDGKGTLLTTVECLSSQNRNEYLQKEELEAYLKDVFGFERILWLENGYLAGDNIYCVMCNDHDAVYNAASDMIKAGHHDFVYLYTSTSFSGMNKLRGFKDAMDEAGIHIDKDRFHLCTNSISKSNDYLSFIYEKNLPFDAILTSDDSLAVGAVKFAYKHGIKVPDELEIVGYNNSVLANCTEPELSSIDSKVEQLSSNAVDLLMEVLGGGSVSNINTVTADLIKRQTTKF